MKSRFRLVFLFCLSLVGMVACSRPDAGREALLVRADSLLGQLPDSALTLLQPLRTERMDRQEAARYALLLARATNKCFRPLLPCDSLLDIALKCYDDPTPERAVALLYKGRLVEEMGWHEEAARLLQEALSVVTRFPEEQETRRHILSSLGNLYFYSGNYDASLPVYRQLYECCETELDKAIALKYIASYYAVKDQIDSSLIAGKQALDCAIAAKDSFMIASNLLAMSLAFNEHDSASYYARLALHWAPEEHSKTEYYYNLGTLFAEDNKAQDSALFYLEKVKDDCTFGDRFLCLQDLADLEAAKGNYRIANTYLQQYIAYADSLIFSEQSTEIERLIYKHGIQMKVQEEQMKSQRLRERMVAGFLLCLVGIVVLFHYRLSKRKRKQRMYEAHLIHTKEKINALQTTIEDNTVIIELLRKEHRQLEEEVQKGELEVREREAVIAGLKKEQEVLQNWLFSQTAIYKKVQALRKQWVGGNKEQKVLDAAGRQKLKETVLDLYSSQVKEWRAHYPRLSEDDLLLLCLQFASFDSQSIAICFGYGDTHTINQRKTRIRERMEE